MGHCLGNGMSFILLLALIVYQSNNANCIENCPTDCICYKDYLSNLESWKWIVSDVIVQEDDPLHEEFNPYTEHNEVYHNPIAAKKRQEEALLNTVTCVMRTNLSEALISSLGQLDSSIEILSLIQAPGTGVIQLEKSLIEKVTSLIALEIKGYQSHNSVKSDNSVLDIAPDAFTHLKRLTYLKLESVNLIKEHIDPAKEQQRFTYNNEFIDDEQVIIIKSRISTKEDVIVPYSVYKEKPKSQTTKKDTPAVSVAFTTLPSLRHLRISECYLEDISWDMFYKLDNLKYLLLDNNNLLFLPDFVFYATPNLTALSLSHNNLLNLQTVGLAGLLTLQSLDVSHNNITHLSELTLPPFPQMEVADFRHNPIESIFPNTFEIMNSTKILFLGSKTTPLEFSMNSFFGLTSLERLDIINVAINFLERPMLRGMPELKQLSMAGKVQRIMYDAFSESPKLEKLVLSKCAIQKISMDAFFGLSSLMELDLSHNDLSFLPPGLFEQQVSLREIFLQHNDLKTLPPSLFRKVPVKILRLENNPWFCSCDMKYWDPKQINQVKRYHVPPPTSIFCDPMYYKKAICYEDYEPKFEVKYVYEKRVSPICSSPEKFQGQSVFEVLRKEYRLCANSLQQNISILLTSSNPTETMEIMGTVKIPVQTAGNNKEMEKRLLFPPKIKKPVKASTSSPVPPANATEENIAKLNITTGTTMEMKTTLTNSELLTQSSLPMNMIITPTDSTFTENNRSSTPHTNATKPDQSTELEEDMIDNNINVMWQPDPQAQVSSINGDSTKGIQHQLPSEVASNSIPNVYPISKKARKYMRSQRYPTKRYG